MSSSEKDSIFAFRFVHKRQPSLPHQLRHSALEHTDTASRRMIDRLLIRLRTHNRPPGRQLTQSLLDKLLIHINLQFTLCRAASPQQARLQAIADKAPLDLQVLNIPQRGDEADELILIVVHAAVVRQRLAPDAQRVDLQAVLADVFQRADEPGQVCLGELGVGADDDVDGVELAAGARGQVFPAE